MAEFGKKDTLIFGGILLVAGVLMKIINDKVETSDWGETYLKARELKLKRLGYLKKAEGETCESCVWRPTYMGTRNYLVACQVCGAEKKLPLRAESNFDRLANEIAEQYEEKGKSQEEAERIGRATAYKVGVAKYGKEGMAKKAIQGRKQNAETFDAEDRDLAGADLRGFYFVDANLEGANLRGANLHFAKLQGANLRGANLRGANLRGANLRFADLLRANLRFADLRGANLQGANFRGADFRGAKLSESQKEMIIAGGGILQ